MKPSSFCAATMLLLLPVVALTAVAQESSQTHEHQGQMMVSLFGGVVEKDVSDDAAQAIAAAVAGDWRSADHRARDLFRHPEQTLMFFSLKPQDTVIEVTPGGGWYSEILAPLLREHGRYIAAMVDPETLPAGGGREYQQNIRNVLETRFQQTPAQFDHAQIVAYNPAAPVLGAPESADVVLTFRNVHNWRMAGQADEMFHAFFAVLKPGGILGVVEHRAATDVADGDRSGYVGQAQMIAMAEAAGFVFTGSSEVNANPDDPKDHPNGVWMLPPTNRHSSADAGKYQAIGESDRMTLRFVKP